MTVNEIVTNQIIHKLDEAEKTGKVYYWVKPFAQGAPKVPLSYDKSYEYSGVNRLLLEPDEYLTKNKANELNCHIRKGAKANMVVFFNVVPKKDSNGEVVLDKNGDVVMRGFLKYYQVYSRSDCLEKSGQNLPSKLNFKRYSHAEQTEQMRQALVAFNSMIEKYCQANKIKVEVIKDGTVAYFSPNHNTIRIPDIDNFRSIYEYAHTVAHEITHSTMIPLNRQGGTSKELYSKEELCAEIGAEMIIQNCGIPDDRQYKNNTIAYLQGWSSYLRNKKQEIVYAAAKAQEASELVMSYAKERERNIDISHDFDGEER